MCSRSGSEQNSGAASLHLSFISFLPSHPTTTTIDKPNLSHSLSHSNRFDSMEVCVECPDGSTIHLEVLESDSVLRLKHRLIHRHHLELPPEKRLELLLPDQKTPLQDDWTVAEYELQQGAVLYARLVQGHRRPILKRHLPHMRDSSGMISSSLTRFDSLDALLPPRRTGTPLASSLKTTSSTILVPNLVVVEARDTPKIPDQDSTAAYNLGKISTSSTSNNSNDDDVPIEHANRYDNAVVAGDAVAPLSSPSPSSIAEVVPPTTDTSNDPLGIASIEDPSAAAAAESIQVEIPLLPGEVVVQMVLPRRDNLDER